MNRTRIPAGARALAGALALSGMGGWAVAGAADDERLARLAPTDQAVARELTAFIARMVGRKMVSMHVWAMSSV